MSTTELQNILDFLHKAEKLKMVLRHCWLTNGRQEDVAEHTWRMALMAVLLNKSLVKKVDMERTLKIIIVHDIAEVVTGDHPAYKAKLANKAQMEEKAMHELVSSLPSELKKEIYSLWQEYEAASTPEARFAKALDKMEALIQHNESDIKTWEQVEYELNLVHGDAYCQYDPTIKALKELIKDETKEKIVKEKPEGRR